MTQINNEIGNFTSTISSTVKMISIQPNTAWYELTINEIWVNVSEEVYLDCGSQLKLNYGFNKK